MVHIATNTGQQTSDYTNDSPLLKVLFAMQVFVEPLRKVVSSSAVTGLLALCKTMHERRFLQSLGMAIGVKSWADDFTTMLQETSQHTQPVRPSQPVEMTREVTVAHVSGTRWGTFHTLPVLV